jgi:anti-sigma factor RsiW
MAQPMTPFDEELLTGYLDGTLSQGDAQRVRLHCEQDPESRLLLEDLRRLRAAALSTRFKAPSEAEWPELPQTIPSKISRTLGWLILVFSTALITGIAYWIYFREEHSVLETLLFVGLPSGLFLLFCSTLLDRLHHMKSDRYLGVKR